MTVAEAALKDAHTGSIMDSYNLAYVQHLTQNGRLDIDVAKQEREMLHRRAHAWACISPDSLWLSQPIEHISLSSHA
jgi:hypothetical protein